MNTQFWIVQAFNGVSYGALLFLVGSGLSLIFGVMGIVNLSHGAYFLWGGYIALSVIWATGSWALSLPVAALAVALIGIAMERLFLRSEGFDHLRTAVMAAVWRRLMGSFGRGCLRRQPRDLPPVEPHFDCHNRERCAAPGPALRRL